MLIRRQRGLDKAAANQRKSIDNIVGPHEVYDSFNQLRKNSMNHSRRQKIMLMNLYKKSKAKFCRSTEKRPQIPAYTCPTESKQEKALKHDKKSPEAPS